MRSLYVVARNVGGRATLQHQVLDHDATYTMCGVSIWEWSRSFSSKPIEVILCKHPACREGSK